MSALTALALVVLAVWPARAEEPAYPAASGYVVDAAGLLREDTKQRVETICKELDEKTGVQIAVAIVPSIAPLEIEDYATRLFEKWGVGQKKENNGVLFVIAVKERRVRFEVGYGLEGLLPDGRVGGLLRGTVVPHLRHDDWNAGVVAGVEAVASIIAKDKGIELASLAGVEPPAEPRARPGSRSLSLPLVVFLFGMVLFLVIVSAVARSQSYGGRRRRGGGWGGGWGGGLGGFGGFGSGGSSSGGGFGGFGGGSSGGGGASSGF
jgi:uncharacterized protein